MTERCSKCGGPATAGPNPLFPEHSRCVRCAAVARVSIPVNLERLADAPGAIAGGPAWPIARDAARGKALANDQARRWGECCRALGMGGNTVGQIDGDVETVRRNNIMETSRIVLATRDVCHAWLLRTFREAAIRKYLLHLAVLIIDEAHTYESVFGSNSAYLFRRLTAAALNAGAPEPPRIIAATATIQVPGEHLEKLTGFPFTVISDEQNGSPRYSRELYHLPLNPKGGGGENQMAKLVTDIIGNDPKAQVIAFHDSRHGVERIVQRINRPREVLPYRSGYLAQDRRYIENQLRNNAIRGVIATSALELGIDMPDLNYGVNLDLPPSRKQFHQRLGRVGRAQPGNFIILAPAGRFTTCGETLREYYEYSVEPSHLYLDNEYINYQQAACLKDELEKSGRDTRVPPKAATWPSGFGEALKNAHGRPPAHLQALSDRRARSRPKSPTACAARARRASRSLPGTKPEWRRSSGTLTSRRRWARHTRAQCTITGEHPTRSRDGPGAASTGNPSSGQPA